MSWSLTCATREALVPAELLGHRYPHLLDNASVQNGSNAHRFHWQLRQMPIYRAVLVNAGRPGQFKKVSLKMLTGSEINLNTRKKQTL